MNDIVEHRFNGLLIEQGFKTLVQVSQEQKLRPRSYKVQPRRSKGSYSGVATGQLIRSSQRNNHEFLPVLVYIAEPAKVMSSKHLTQGRYDDKCICFRETSAERSHRNNCAVLVSINYTAERTEAIWIKRLAQGCNDKAARILHHIFLLLS